MTKISRIRLHDVDYDVNDARIDYCTQSEYDALLTKDSNKLYVVSNTVSGVTTTKVYKGSLLVSDSTIVDTSTKADKVSGATNNDFAALDSNGNLKDSGKNVSDFVSQEDIENVAYIEEDDQTTPIADFDPQTDTIWNKEQVLSSAQKAQVLSNLGLDTTLTLLQEQYDSLTQSDIIVGPLPVSGVANKIYRVPGTTDYSDYMWYNSNFVLMATYNNAIDNEPTANSNNLVKSGGVYNQISQLGQKLIKLTGMGNTATKGGVTQVGDIYYNTTSKNLRKINALPDATYDVIPFYDGAIYTIGDDFYVWDGSDLVYAQSGLIKDLDSPVNDVISFEIGTIAGTTGLDSISTNRARSNYINGRFAFAVSSGWIVKFLFKYSRSANGSFSFIEYEEINQGQITATDNNKWYRVVVAKSDNSDLASGDLSLIASSFKGKLSHLITDQENDTSSLDTFKGDFVAFQKGKIPNYNWEQGAITSVGTENTDATRIKTKTYFHSDGNPVSVDFKEGLTCRYFSYDSTKTFVSYNEESSSFQFTPVNGYYYRFVLLRTGGGNISPADITWEDFSADGFPLDANDYINGYVRPLYAPGSSLSGKVVAFLGDSITRQSSATSQMSTYHGVFAQKTGCVVRNLGVNGTCIADNTKNGLGSTRFVTRATSENLSDVAMVVVFGGTNDFAYDLKPIGNLFDETTITPSGNIGDKQLTAPTDQETFAGALHNLIQTIQANVPAGTPILFITPLHRNHNVASNPDYTQANANGDYMSDFVNAIKKICAFYAIPVLDLYSMSQLNPLSAAWSEIFSDGLHPNNAGHKIIGELLYKFYKTNIVI